MTKTQMKRAASVLLFFAALAICSPALAQQPGGDKGTSAKSVQRLNKAPVSHEVLQVQLPRPTETKLKNGLSVIVLEQHKLPTVAFVLWVKGGALADPKDLPGLAETSAAMLREGTAKRNSSQIATATDQLGATLSTNAAFGSGITSVSISGLVESADKMAELMSDVALNPAFPEPELAKYKSRKLPQLEEQRSDASFLAEEKFYEVLYRDFPAAVISATPESVKAITVSDLKKFHDTWFAPNNAILGVVGDVTQAQALALANKYFGGWAMHAVPASTLPPVPQSQPKKAYLIDRPGSVQTNLVTGNLGIKRTDADYISLVVMNRILGAGASSRLFLELREEKGYTYGSYSGFNANLYPGVVEATSEQRNAVTKAAMDSLLDELRKMREEPVPAAELDESKRSIVAVFALSLESPTNLLNRWLTVKYYGLPVDYWDTYPAKVNAITAQDIEQTAKKYIDLDHLQIVVVGDSKQPGTEEKENAKTIKDVVSGFAPTEMFDAEGKPMKAKAAAAEKPTGD
ncbi:MAG: insulinase family protein [Acidobacteriota bacterium]|nr:insulinase family protein [Acidobacteriota bacterium]